MKICPKCNKKYKDDKDFCRECGTGLVKKEINKKKILIISLIPILIISVLIYLNSNKPVDYEYIEKRIVELVDNDDELKDKSYGLSFYYEYEDNKSVYGCYHGYTKNINDYSFSYNPRKITNKYYCYNVEEDKFYVEDSFKLLYDTVYNELKLINDEWEFDKEYINDKGEKFYAFTPN